MVKTEALGNDVPQNHDAAARVIGDDIERHYNSTRRHLFVD